MRREVASFTIEYKQILDPQGKLLVEDKNIPAFINNQELILQMYNNMLQTRIFDAKAIALQRTGKLGTYPSPLGQEAIGTGIASAMRADDVLCPYYREQAAQLWRGVSMEEIYLYWGGDELGSNYRAANVNGDFPNCVPIASQTLHAAGVATAFKLRKQRRAAVAVIGDAGTSRGDFYEAMNLAGVWKLPVVFVINNNKWGISTPAAKQTACETFAQKGIAAGIASHQVDGDDVFAVHAAVSEALQKAYSGAGPTVIEALSYREADHTTADDASRYRNQDEIIQHQKLDPITRLYNYLTSNNHWDATREQQLKATIAARVEKAVADYLNVKTRPANSMFDHIYAELPFVLEQQKKALET